MTNIEALQAYRAAVLDLNELNAQLERVGTTGAPQELHGMQLGSIRGTNDPAAAASQAADGMEALIQRKRDELAGLAAMVWPLISKIGAYRTYMVVQQYYMKGETDSNIARDMCISRSRVNQIRLNYLASVS